MNPLLELEPALEKSWDPSSSWHQGHISARSNELQFAYVACSAYNLELNTSFLVCIHIDGQIQGKVILYDLLLQRLFFCKDLSEWNCSLQCYNYCNFFISCKLQDKNHESFLSDVVGNSVISFLWVLLSLLLQRYRHILTHIHSCAHISQTKIGKNRMGRKRNRGRQISEMADKIPKTAGHILYITVSCKTHQ